jgi:hypothetical protein
MSVIEHAGEPKFSENTSATLFPVTKPFSIELTRVCSELVMSVPETSVASAFSSTSSNLVSVLAIGGRDLLILFYFDGYTDILPTFISASNKNITIHAKELDY